MNCTLEEATVQRYYYDTHQHLRDHLHTFLLAYNIAKRLKSLHGLSPYKVIYQQWQHHPHLFLKEPFHLTLGLYT